MIKFLTALVAVAATFCVNAEVWDVRYGVAEVFNFKLYNTDGTLDTDEVDSGTEVSLSCNEGNETTATNDFADEGNFYSISLTAAELQCERVAVVIAATTTEVFFIQTHSNASALTPTYEVNVASVTSGAIAAADFAAGAIDATAVATGAIDADAIAADAIGASELATDAIGAAEIASAAIAADEIATDAIGAAELASAAIAADEIATDAIGAAELAASAIGESELATGAITTAEFAAGAIDAAAIAADAIGSSELAAAAINDSELNVTGSEFTAIDLPNQTMDITGAIVGNITGNLSGSVGSVTGAVGSVTAVSSGAITEASYASTAGSFDALGIVDQGTGQAGATGTTFVLRSAASFADDLINGGTILLTGGTGVGQSRTITDYVSSTDTATVDTWTTTPDNTSTYQIYGTAPSSGGAGASAADVWAYSTRSLTILDEDSTTLDLNATAVVTGSITDGAIAAADFAAGAIDASAIAADAIGASELATDAIGAAEIAASAITNSELASDGSEFTAIDLPNQTMDISGTLTTVTTATNVTTVNGFAANALVAADIDPDVTTELQAGLATATAVDDLPTNAELATSQGTADDATLTAIAALNDITTAEVRDLVIEDNGSVTLGCAIAVVLAYAAGDLTTAGGDSIYEDPSGTETRATGTVASAGNRTAAITCPTY
jgi:hypothetical protein